MYIHNWDIVAKYDAKRGDVVAEAINYSDATGHVGIVVAADGNIGESVSVDRFSGYVVKSEFGFRSTEDSKFRRFTGSSWALIDSLMGPSEY